MAMIGVDACKQPAPDPLVAVAERAKRGKRAKRTKLAELAQNLEVDT